MSTTIRNIDQDFAKTLDADRLVGFDYSGAPADKNAAFVEIKGTEGNTIKDTEDGFEIDGQLIGAPVEGTDIATDTNVNTLTPGLLYPIDNGSGTIKLVTTGTLVAGTFLFRIGSNPSVNAVTVGNDKLNGHSGDVVFDYVDDIGLVFRLVCDGVGYSLDATPAPPTVSIAGLMSAGTVTELDDDTVDAADLTGVLEFEFQGFNVVADGGAFTIETTKAARNCTLLFTLSDLTNNCVLKATKVDNLSGDLTFTSGMEDAGFALKGDGATWTFFWLAENPLTGLASTHIALGTAAHAATAVSFAAGGSGLAATEVNAAIVENAGDLTDHEGEATAAHAATAVSYSNATSGLEATEANTAIDEVFNANGAVIADPGDGGAIPVTKSGVCALTTVDSGAEARSLAAPAKAGLQLIILLVVDGGADVVVTAAYQLSYGSTNLTLTYANEAESTTLISVPKNGGGYKWEWVSGTAALA